MNTVTKSLLAATLLTAPNLSFADFSGPYIGLSFGPNLNNEIYDTAFGDALSADDSTSVGFVGGYQVQNGDLVFGGRNRNLRIARQCLQRWPVG